MSFKLSFSDLFCSLVIFISILEMSAIPLQMQHLMEFMENHPDVANNDVPRTTQGKNELNKLWRDLAARLNAKGPPTKSVTAWRKVWTDYKYRTKKKCGHFSLSMKKTRGGSTEEVPILEIKEELTSSCASLIGSNSKCFGAPQMNSAAYMVEKVEVEETLIPSSTGDLSFVYQRSPTPSSTYMGPSTSKRRKKIVRHENTNSATAMLKQQIANDKIFQNKLLRIKTVQLQQEVNFHRKVISLLEKRNEIAQKQLEKN